MEETETMSKITVDIWTLTWHLILLTSLIFVHVVSMVLQVWFLKKKIPYIFITMSYLHVKLYIAWN